MELWSRRLSINSHLIHFVLKRENCHSSRLLSCYPSFFRDKFHFNYISLDDSFLKNQEVIWSIQIQSNQKVPRWRPLMFHAILRRTSWPTPTSSMPCTALSRRVQYIPSFGFGADESQTQSALLTHWQTFCQNVTSYKAGDISRTVNDVPRHVLIQLKTKAFLQTLFTVILQRSDWNFFF